MSSIHQIGLIIDAKLSLSFLAQGHKMFLSNLEFMTGKKVIKHLGLVQGSSVRAKHAGKDIMSGIKNMFGGELTAYTELLHESREEATERMVEQAKAIGANAVLNIRYSTSSITAGAAEIYVYGTAVVLDMNTDDFSQ